MAHPISIYCFGCGTDLTSTPTERRSLTSENNAHVAQVWKAFVVDENEPDVDLDCILSGDGIPEKAGKLCRKCQSIYERYSKMHDTIQNNMKKAIDVMPNVFPSSTRLVPPLTKKPRLGRCFSDYAGHSSKRSQSASSESPDVLVS